MKATFLIPPSLDGKQSVDRTSGCNRGIYFIALLPFLYSATLLKEEVEELAILDFAARKKTPKDFERFVKEDDSDIYVFYTVFLCQETDFKARRMIRASKKKVYFIYTGPQATYAPQDFLDEENTFCVRGEPEYVVKNLVHALKNGSGIDEVKGISFKRDNVIVHNGSVEFIKDLDEIPIPDRTLLDHAPYYNPKLHRVPNATALTSRGCFGRCWYCVPNSLDYARELEYKKCHGAKPPPRLHSVERVKEEFTELAKSGFKSVSILDDEFLWSEKRTIDICEAIKGLNLEWSCLARPDKITEKSAQAMAEAGCSYIDLGAESFDEGVLKAIRKDMSAEDTKRAVRILKKYGIRPELNILFGATPEETEETIKRTLKAVRELDVDYVLFSIANPFPGTDFYDAAKKNGWLIYGEYVPVDPAVESIISYPHLSKEKLEKYASYAYRSHYFSPRYLLKEFKALKSFRDFMNKFNTAFHLAKRSLR